MSGWKMRKTLSNDHASWLEDSRGIPCETAAELGIVSDGDAIGFEYRRNGQLTHTKWRKLDKSRMWITPDGSQQYLWNIDSLSEATGKSETLVITEGEFDTAAWMAAGVPYVVSVPNGAHCDKPGEGDIDPSNDGGFAYLWQGGKLARDIDKFDRIIISTDGDRRGMVLRDELAVRLGRSRCWYVDYPEGCKDANDVLVRHGLDGIGRLYRSARPIVPSRLVSFGDIPEQAARIRYSSGWGFLDRHLMICPPELIVITGTPNAGKSQWALALGCNLARVHKLRGAILQFEDNVERNRRHILRYARAWQSGNFGINEEPTKWVDRMFLTIPPPEADDADEEMNVAWLQETITEAARRHGCRWLIADPWNEIEHAWRVNETETGYTNQALRDLKRLARKLQMALIIVTHPGKSANGKTIEDLSLYDVSGSAAWKNKADHGIVIWRSSPESDVTHVKVDKSKDYDVMGVPGTVTMRFDAASSTFREASQ